VMAFLGKIKDKASAAMGLDKDKKALEDEKEAHAQTKEQLGETEKRVAAMAAAMKEMELKLQQAQNRINDLEHTLQAINEEKDASAAAELAKAQELAKAETEKVQMEAAEKKAALEHCQAIYNAFKAMFTDDAALAANICPFPWPHVSFMLQLYLGNFGQDMIKKVKAQTSGLFRELLLGLLQSPEDFVVGLLNDAVGTLSSDEGVMVELLCSATNAELKLYKDLFQKRFGKDLVKRMTDAFSGELKKLMTVVLQGNREETTAVDQTQVDADATLLYSAGEAKLVGVDEAPFIQVIGNRSPAHLIALNEHYKTKSKKGRSLLEAVDRQFGGRLRTAFQTLLVSNMDRPGFFAQLVRDACEGIGCNEAVVLRTVVARRYKDLGAVRAAYNKLFATEKDQPFDKRLESELGGHLKTGVMLILGSIH